MAHPGHQDHDAGEHSPAGEHSHSALHAIDPAVASAAAVASLRRQRERVTGARRAIIELLAAADDHLSAERIATLLDPAIHRATVYRTLERLGALGILSLLHPPGGPALYHLTATDPRLAHLHGRCGECGRIVALPAGLLDGAVDEARDVGFVLSASESSLAGLCADCARRD